MNIRTTVTLDEDVFEGIKGESRSRGVSFKATLNELLRTALLTKNQEEKVNRTFLGQPMSMGVFPHLNYDDIEGLIEYGEGEMHR